MKKLLLGAVIAICPQFVLADTLAFNYSFSAIEGTSSLTPGQSQAFVTLDAFDASLGALNSVKITATNTIEGRLEVFDATTLGQLDTSIGLLGISASRFVGSTSLTILEDCSTPSPGLPSCVKTATGSISEVDGVTISGADWDAAGYSMLQIGTGAGIQITDTFSSFFSADLAGSFSSDIVLEYDFTPAVIPLPAGAGLLLSGLAVVFGAGRFGRMRGKA